MEIPGSYKWRSRSPGDGGGPSPSRRLLLASAFAGLLPAQTPAVHEFDLSLLDELLTPGELFFVREHFPQPAVSAVGWKLTVGGAVATPLGITYDDLAARPRRALPVTLECAENPVGGGLVSHGEWAGVSLASLLEAAQPAAEARFVQLSGADGYTRSIPLSKAAHPDTLVAIQMNGEKLPPNHGFPARAIIPGWYGMDSVKWLRQLDVLTSPPQQPGYVRQVRSLLAGVRPAEPVSTMQVKSVFSRPLDGAILSGRRFTVRGAAWAGEHRVRLVEVSTDGGKSWDAAKLTTQSQPYVWAHWAHEWKIAATGPHQLVVRAADDRGRQQPMERASSRVDDYELDSCQSIQVLVR